MATERQIAANRLNALKGGVKTPEGKAISRLNARTHGIFASALTEADAEELRSVLDELIEDLKPVGFVEELLVDKLAVTYLRMRRCAQAEALHFRHRWNSVFENPGEFAHDEKVGAIGLYDARLTHQFLRLLHEIECRKKARAQERERDMAQPTESVSLSHRPAALEPPPSQARPAPGADDQGAPVPHTQNEPNPAEQAPATPENSRPAKLQNESRPPKLQNEPIAPGADRIGCRIAPGFPPFRPGSGRPRSNSPAEAVELPGAGATSNGPLSRE